MDFQTLNLEKDPAPALLGKYDFVIATNVVHATSSLVNSTRRIRSLLKEDGFLVLSEVARIVDWYDLVYGLLEGWWLANDGRDYPLVPVETWVKDLKTAGFNDVAFSHGSSEESKSQQLIVASLKQPKVQFAGGSTASKLKQRCRPETVVYKIVDETEIHADIYYPSQPTSEPMPIALMIHGGGYMTLSKKAIRPAQTLFLLENGILPISFDYRLCPEINLVDGPITDVRDALAWAQTQLPGIACTRSITIDTDNIFAIGWSSGGHLAMSTAWTSQPAGLKPPRAIISFYGPTDFESPEMDRRRAEEYPERTMSLDRIRASLPKKPITSYDNDTVDTTGLGWVRPGDPRSELVLSLFKEGNGLNLLLNGLSSTSPPSPERIASISPMAHLRAGTYNTPTFLIHGDRDEIVPFGLTVAFEKALRERGVNGGMCAVKGARHIHDLHAVEGDETWERGVARGYEFLLGMLGK